MTFTIIAPGRPLHKKQLQSLDAPVIQSPQQETAYNDMQNGMWDRQKGF